MSKKSPYLVVQTAIGGGPIISQIIVGEITDIKDRHITIKAPVAFARIAMMMQTPNGPQTNFDTQAMDDHLFPMKRDLTITVSLDANPYYRITDENDDAVKLHTAAFAAKAGLQATSQSNVTKLKS